MVKKAGKWPAMRRSPNQLGDKMKNLMIASLVALTTLNIFPLHAAEDTNPLETFLGTEAARVSQDFLSTLNPCDAYPNDFECQEIKIEATNELARRLNIELWHKFLPGLSYEPESKSAVHGVMAEGIYEIAHAAAEMAMEVHEDQKRLDEMKKRRIEQANKNGYGHILVQTLHEQGL